MVNDVSSIFLECFKAHVHDLEDALIDFMSKPTKEAELQTALQKAQMQLKESQEALESSQRSCMTMKKEMDIVKDDALGSQGDAKRVEAQLQECKGKLAETEDARLALNMF